VIGPEALVPESLRGAQFRATAIVGDIIIDRREIENRLRAVEASCIREMELRNRESGQANRL
jgi:hypothetical protein